MKKILLILFIFMCPIFLMSQKKSDNFCVGVHGVISDYFSGRGMKKVKVSLINDNKETYKYTRRSGFYAFELDSGKVYTILFQKENMVDKSVLINTNECDCSDTTYYDMDLQMTLFKRIDNFDFSLFKMPIAMATYSPTSKNMVWFDNYHTLKMSPLIMKTMSSYVKSVNGYFSRKGELPMAIIDSLILDKDSTEYVELRNDSIIDPIDNIMSKIGYNDSDSIFEVETSRGLFYTVQVGVYSRSRDLKKIYNINDLNSELLEDGKIRYTSGRFISIKTAESYRMVVYQLGVKDAFITAYHDGKRITIKESKDLIDKYGFDVLLK